MCKGAIRLGLWLLINCSFFCKVDDLDTFQCASHIIVPTGDHVFPPPSGLSYSLWFTVERHDSPMHPHPTRLLTLVRHDVDRGKATAGSVGQGFVCLVLLLLPRHHTVMLSTQDQPLHELGIKKACRDEKQYHQTF